jgi:hypothetical protein
VRECERVRFAISQQETISVVTMQRYASVCVHAKEVMRKKNRIYSTVARRGQQGQQNLQITKKYETIVQNNPSVSSPQFEDSIFHITFQAIFWALF